MRENNTQSVFNATASTYDRQRSCLIPCYDRFYATALSLIPPGSTRILDLGAGSGLFSELVREAFPSAHLHLLDFSAPMLDIARERLAPLQSLTAPITYELADYTTADYPQPLDVIVSSLSIHHLDDPAKQLLLRKSFAALRPGGIFINADHIAGPTPALEAEYQQRWLDEIRSIGATEQQIADSLYRQQEDRRSSVPDQLTWIAAAGFIHVDCWFKDGNFAVLTGTRP